MAAKPVAQIVESASIRAAPLRRILQSGRRRLALQHCTKALLEAPVIVLQRQQQHVALLALNVAEGVVAARTSNREIERQPAFPGLRLAGQDRQALGDDLRHGPFDRPKFPRHQLGGRSERERRARSRTVGLSVLRRPCSIGSRTRIETVSGAHLPNPLLAAR